MNGPLPTPVLYEHADGRRLVALPGSTLVAGDPAWYRAGPVQIDPALLRAEQEALKARLIRALEHA